MSFRPFALMALVLAGCATEDQVKKLEERIVAMETKVAELEKRPSSGRSAPAPAANPELEAEAGKAIEEIQALSKDGKTAEARAKITEFNAKYASTSTAARARKMLSEMEVVGKDAPAQLAVDKWFQGEGKVNIKSDDPTLLVFWEVWCPHCKRELPEMETGVWKNYKDQGLQVVALTRMTKNKTDEDVQKFIDENKLTFPIAKEKGDLAQYFGVSGIPAAAVVKDGKIVWRGHPNGLTDDMIKGWL